MHGNNSSPLRANPTENHHPQPSEPRHLVCSNCQSTLFRRDAFRQAWISQGGGFRYSISSASVRDAARECKWCRLLLPILSTAQEYTRGVGDSGVENEVVKFTASKYGTLAAIPVGNNMLSIEVPLPNNGSYLQMYEIHANASGIASRYIASREVKYQVSTFECYAQALDELHACTNTSSRHKSCHQASKGLLPTRVIDCLDPNKPKLYIPQLGECDFYIALSYVWGEDQPYKLSTVNIASYVLGIDLEVAVTRPQTILDAITCTRSLGLRFLWIDALCILQDSDEDKARELPLMRRIYRDAYVTIIAASASKVSEGFLQDRAIGSPAMPLPFVCPDGEGVEQADTMYIRDPLRTDITTTDPISSRAWCLQERLLPHRSLIYSKSLKYACCSQTPAEVGNTNRPSLMDMVRLPPFMFHPDTHAILRRTLHMDEENLLRTCWNQIVVKYTKCDLSNPNDKLVALGGVADEFHRFWHRSHYLAGLWSHNLLEDLLWSTDETPDMATKRYGGTDAQWAPAEVVHRAPTWSWASVKARVTTAEKMNLLWPSKCHYLCKVLLCSTTLVYPTNPFGAVMGGVLEIRAMLTKALWNPAESSLYTEGSRTLITRHAPRDCDEEASRTEGSVWVIPIRRCEGGGFDSVEGIVVVPESKTSSRYCRVGAFTIGIGKVRDDFDPETWLVGAATLVTIV
ncbi:hypothetical protein AB1N83_011533 [Pleurotus pulmonarius]